MIVMDTLVEVTVQHNHNVYKSEVSKLGEKYLKKLAFSLPPGIYGKTISSYKFWFIYLIILPKDDYVKENLSARIVRHFIGAEYKHLIID